MKRISKAQFDKLYETLLEKELLDRKCFWNHSKSSVNWRTSDEGKAVLSIVERKDYIKWYADEEFLKLI